MLLSLQVKDQSVRIHAAVMDESVTTHNETVVTDCSVCTQISVHREGTKYLDTQQTSMCEDVSSPLRRGGGNVLFVPTHTHTITQKCYKCRGVIYRWIPSFNTVY